MKFKKGSNGGLAVELGPAETKFSIIEGPLPDFRLKKILVPVDFSDCSEKALQYAVPFARQFAAEVVLLHLVEPYPQVPEMGPVDVESLHDAKEQMDIFRKSVEGSVSVETLVRIGEATAGIIEAAKELDIDLIIVSTHARTGMARVFLGSTAEQIVRRAPCPVLVVRQREREFVACEEHAEH